MKKPAYTILVLCFVIITAFLLTTCDGGGGGGGAIGDGWGGVFVNTQFTQLVVGFALSGGSIPVGVGQVDEVGTLDITFTGTYTSGTFSISGTASGGSGDTTFTATGTVTVGALGDGSSSASGTYSMNFAGLYTNQTDEDWAMVKQ